MIHLIRKANGTTVRVTENEYLRILARVAEGERADKLADEVKPQEVIQHPAKVESQ